MIFKEAFHWNDIGLHPNIAYCYFVKLIDEEVDWHEDVEPYVRNFLTLHNIQWTDEQFDLFYQKLQYANLGWIRKEGVLKKMKEIAGMKE
jgi:hypothetical protein